MNTSPGALQADQTTDNYTQKWLVASTHMWHPQLYGLSPTTLYVLLIVGIVVIVGITYILLRISK